MAEGASTVARRPSIAAAGALACGAVALWISLGALAFVAGSDVEAGAAASTPLSYVGLLPPLSLLALFLLIAALIAILLRPSAGAVAPLWLSAVAVLPWLPFRLPLSVFIWTGNVLLWLWTLIVMAIAAPSLARAFHPQARSAIRNAFLAGLLSTMAFGLGTWWVAPQHPDGDEPHYLIITQSILQDRDLKIENNHRQRDYEVYLGRSIKPDFLKRSKDGQIYSIHAPGLPAIIAPAFALFGYRGALIELVLLSAAASALVWFVAWRVTSDAAAAWFAWAAVTLSVPFFFHASALFPDGLGGVLTLVGLLPIVDSRARAARPLFFVGAALAVLPWLNSRFVFLAATAALVIGARVAQDRSRVASRLAAFAIVPAASALAFFSFFQVIYGTPNPSVVYGNVPSMSLSTETLARGVPGLLFDQQFGIIPNAPVFLCAFAGLVVMLWRGPRRLALELLFIALPYLLIAASFTSWWGGTTAPARYFVPVTLILAVPAAIWFATATGVAARTISLASLFISLLTTATIASVDRGAFVFNFRDGMSRVARWLTPVVDLTRALPSLFQNPPSTVLVQTAVWTAALAVAVLVGALLSGRGRAAVILGFGLALEVASMGAVSWVWRSNHAAVVTPYAAGSVVLQHYDPEARQIAVAYRPFHRLDRTALPGRIVLARTFLTVPGAESALLTHLPAGTYEIKGTATGSLAGRLRLRTDRVSGPVAEWDVASFGPTWTRQVAIPVALAGLQIEADAAARNAIHDVSVRALSLSGPPDGFENREARRGAHYGLATVFLMRGDAWMEPMGTWVAGGSNAEFAIAPDAQSTLELFMRNGPVANRVTLESATWKETLTLEPGAERTLPLPRDRRRLAIPLKVTAATGFRPADFDPKTEDVRFLGVWIETR